MGPAVAGRPCLPARYAAGAPSPLRYTASVDGRAGLADAKVAPAVEDAGPDEGLPVWGGRHAEALGRIETLTRWMDRRYIDPIVGFVLPGVGDVVGAAIGLYTVLLARRMGYPKVVLARMLINLSVDSLVGAIPILGAVFDIAFRANVRNLAILRERPPARSRPSDWLVVLGAAALLLAALTMPIVAFVVLLRAVF